MNSKRAVAQLLKAQRTSGKPLAIVLAGHNGSGKSTYWYKRLAPAMRVPLINADRMMMSILPERDDRNPLPKWASRLRDTDASWMQVAQRGVQAFVAQAMAFEVPFAMETVFSHLQQRDDGTFESKIELIEKMQAEHYFVLLIFVGLASAELSIARVTTRVAQGGHAVATARLRARFPRTQKAIGLALDVADAALLVDNSRTERRAFTVCRVQIGRNEIFDLRKGTLATPRVIRAWLDLVSPQVNLGN